MSSDRAETHFEPCGGCGAQNPSDRCIGCFHDFTPSAALRSGGEEKNGVDHIADAGRKVEAPAVDGETEELARRLRDFTKAYPETIFPPISRDEREWIVRERHGFVDRISADMGRHFAQFATEAADALVSLRAENERLRKDLNSALRANEVLGLTVDRCRIDAATLTAKLEEAAKVLEQVADAGAAWNDWQNMDSFMLISKAIEAAKSFLANLKGAE